MNILKNLVPKFVRRRISKALQGHYLRLREQEDNSLPKLKLAKSHIENLKSLVDRQELLEHFPKGGVVAEIGVAEGGFTQKIMDICDPFRCHLIDSWDSKRYSTTMKEKVWKQFDKQIRNGQVVIFLGDSVNAASSFPDHYFDWIYLDSDHSYEHTKRELEAYRSKMKKDGIIAGHDFIQGNWVGGMRYGVIEAVYEFCIRYDWEMIYLTTNFIEHPSFAIRSTERPF